MSRRYERHSSQDYNIKKVQDRIEAFDDKLSSDCPLLNGILLTDISIGAARTKIEHKLGHSPAGWIITKLDTDTNIISPNSVASPWADSNYLYLQAGLACKADIWVF